MALGTAACVAVQAGRFLEHVVQTRAQWAHGGSTTAWPRCSRTKASHLRPHRAMAEQSPCELDVTGRSRSVCGHAATRTASTREAQLRIQTSATPAGTGARRMVTKAGPQLAFFHDGSHSLCWTVQGPCLQVPVRRRNSLQLWEGRWPVLLPVTPRRGWPCRRQGRLRQEHRQHLLASSGMNSDRLLHRGQLGSLNHQAQSCQGHQESLQDAVTAAFRRVSERCSERDFEGRAHGS